MSPNPTSDGFSFTPDGGISTGLSSPSVITPSQCFTSTETLYDAIVVGAGWTGITTARDLTSRGFKVLLIEARDRIGGRTWTSVIDGHPFELGGTYVHWGQSHVWTEITRYNLQDSVTDVFDNSDDTASGLNDSDLAEALTKFFNVDGYNGAKVIPFPHNPAIGDATHVKYDSMSLDDRLQEIRGDLDPSIITPLVVMLLCNGGDLETKSFFEFLQRWALCGYNAKGYVDYHIRYKLKIGQSDFLKHLWKHALQTGNLSYRFSSPVNSVDTTNADDTTITTTDGTIYHARKVIVTVPLAVLKQILFLPTLPHLKAEAYAQATGNIAAKVIAVATGTDWVGRSVFADNDDFTFTMTGESVAAWGNDTILVAFHVSTIQPRTDPHGFLDQLRAGHPDLKIKRMIWCDYTNDPYFRGGWAVADKGYTSKYMDALHEPFGNVIFASGDYDHGFRAFIDGAVAQGIKAARAVELALGKRSRPTRTSNGL